MTTLLVAHDTFGDHETPAGHPEQQARYGAIDRALSAPDFDYLERRRARPADREALLRAHGAAYVDRILHTEVGSDLIALDPDTFMGPSTLKAALLGAGGAMGAVDWVMEGTGRNAFVAARPPGHHAETEKAMGFCLFNNAAVAAFHARAAHGLKRVAVLDFDVHHGNGTEAIFRHDPDAFFASSHEWPQYPGTGKAEDHGEHGQIHNAPLATGTDGKGFARAWAEDLLPALEAFAPEFIVISAGFDAHREDPLGGLELTEADFAWITAEIRSVADRVAKGRVVSVLEGGYNLGALGRSVAAHVKGLAS